MSVREVEDLKYAARNILAAGLAATVCGEEDVKQELINTQKLADLFGVQAQTVRWNLCKKGHYYGLKPTRLPNRRLMWRKDEALKVLGFETEQGG